ncbi:hypothetical protein H2203_001397 [Taxawa tesnikishii (nom. ined.)]|nr:hypothetical protein H2203_001397 [Dothideales sp. JES 119]
MTETFSNLVHAIRDGSETPESAAQALYDQLTESERLGLLQGDDTFFRFVFKIAWNGYGRTPCPSGVIPRLGIPGIQFTDGPRGVLLGHSTAFPVAAARAGTWDPALEEEVGHAMGAECRAQGGNFFAGICVNLARHPGWGRAQESYGEDPLVLGTMGSALARGAREHAMACVKHFALNSMENARFTVDVEVDDETLHECYLPHFKQIVTEAGIESVMSAYNAVNGTACGDSHRLLTGILREEWNRPDLVVVDDFVWGIRDGPGSVKAGCDIEFPVKQIRSRTLPDALKNGSLDWTDVKKSCLRTLAAQLRYHERFLDVPTPDISVVGSEAHRKLARRVATESMVLLKNSEPLSVPFLPLQKSRVKKVAVVGALANSIQTGDFGSSYVDDKEVISPLQGFLSNPDIETMFSDGTNIDAAVRTAEAADICVLISGYTSYEEGEHIMNTDEKLNQTVLPGWFGSWPAVKAMSFFAWMMKASGRKMGGDRQHLGLNAHNEKLCKAIATAVGERAVLVLEASSTVLLPSEIRNGFAAILWAWYGGCQIGHALQDVLWGDAEPSGRLTFSVPESEEDLPVWDINAKKIKYDRYWGYRYLQKINKTAVYPFGFGLGYGHIEIQKDQLRCPKVLHERFFSVSVAVRNIGNRPSSVVLQIYGG